jgi:hypothetical protein
MPMPISETSKAILEVLSDKEWHNRWDVYVQMSHKIPAGLALRRHDSERRGAWLRARRVQDPDAPPLRGAEAREDLISRGRRYLFQRMLYDLLKMGYVEHNQPPELSIRQYERNWKVRITERGVSRLTLARG